MVNTKVAILISTMNRPDFLIRTLNYYVKMNSPHPVYLGDSSSPENAGIIKTFIVGLKDKLEINYHWFPPGFDNLEKLLSLIKEKYIVVNGDDDYEIPSSLTKCAEFLENNPDYASAGGYGVTFRLKTSGPYGDIARLADYPRVSLEAETASQRLMDFMKNCFTITFAVNRANHMREILVGQISIIGTWNELSETCSCAIAGKSKLIDCLGFVRQIHDRQYYANSMIDWLTDKNFHNSYMSFKELLTEKITEKDKISRDRAELVIRDSFWEYLQVYLANSQKDLKSKDNPLKNRKVLKTLRSNIGKRFPVLKTAYRRYLRPFISDKKQLHYDVLDPHSTYYKDFKPVWDSFGERDLHTPQNIV